MKKDLVGWIGVLMILTAFIVTTLGIISPQTVIYGALNAFGALGIIISSYIKKDFQPVVLNIVWLIVALLGLIKIALSL